MMSDDSTLLSSSSSSASAYSPPSQTFQFDQQNSPPSNRSSSVSTITDSDQMNEERDEKNVPYVNFYCRSNSNAEIIEERVIYLDKSCKIGRSVAKIKPETNNAIFDCKVLSRNHACLWYESSKVSILC